MSTSLATGSIAFSLTAVCTWGISDFIGGFAVRRANAFLMTMVTHAAGLALIVSLSFASGSALPSLHAILWAVVGGFSGGAALAVFYRALSSGSMGLAATVGAVLGAAVPAVFGIVTQGWPGNARLAGFLLAGLGIWLISRTEGKTRPEGLGMAALAGIGFAGFFLCMKQAGDGSALWLATYSRAASLLLTALVVVLGRNFGPLPRQSAVLATVAGCLDVSGTALFVRACQTGRLDVAVVLSSLYPVITVVLAKLILKEHFTRWKIVGLVAGLAAVPLIAGG